MTALGTAMRVAVAAAWLAAVTATGAAAATAGGAAAAGTTNSAGGGTRSDPATRRFTLFYTAEIHGTVEPCGCTSDPLGDISRLATVLADARRGGRAAALVDAGGLLYPEGSISARERPSADLRAGFLGRELERLGLAGIGLGETDLSGGTTHLGPKRLASNIKGAGDFVGPPTIQKLGGVTVGVLGVAEAALAATLGGRAEDMTVTARHDIEALRRAGAEIVVLLAPIDRNVARKLARDVGPDVVVLGKRVGHGMPRAEQVGRAFLVSPEDEMQKVGRIEIVLREGPPGGTASATGAVKAPVELVDAGGPDVTRLRRDEINHALERLRLGLASWAKGSATSGSAGAGGSAPPAPSPSATSSANANPTARSNGDTTATPTTPADPAFVAAKKRELAELEAERSHLTLPWQPPAIGSYLINTLVPLRRNIKQDAAMRTRMKALDRAIAAANLKQATPPPPAEPGRAAYVGMAQCTSCHKAATTFWNHTVHAHAWKTLVDGGKQADLKCIGCHVTGFGQIGGSSLGFTKKLESVQCETCHGPGSLHVAGAGNEEPLAIKRETPETVCLGCHTEQHSDTFSYKPYLRDIVGAGHGAKLRETLGPGPTGHELRSAALARAKVAAATAPPPAP